MAEYKFGYEILDTKGRRTRSSMLTHYTPQHAIESGVRSLSSYEKARGYVVSVWSAN